MEPLFTHSLRSDRIYFRHARGVSTRAGKEFHIYHEIILFLGGQGELICETLRCRLAPNTLIVIPRETYHQVLIHGDPQAYYRCVLNFEDEEVPELLAGGVQTLRMLPADGKLQYLFEILKETARTQAQEASVLQAVLVLVLRELAARNGQPGQGQQVPLVRQVIDYVNRNLAGECTVARIAGACNVSASTLAHTFKKEMNIPLHRYILQKRLIAAHHKLADGVPATAAATECGFSDYSGFYRQYKKQFGKAPSA